MLVLTVVAALGGVQGILLLFLIGFRYRCERNLPLALFLLLFSIRLGTAPTWTPQLLLSAPWILSIVGPLPLLFGPLVWWYVRALTHGDDQRPRRMAIHAVPWAVETIALVIFLQTRSPEDYRELVAAVFASPGPWWMTVRHVVKVVHGGMYAVAAARIVYGRRGKHSLPEQPTRLWAQFVVTAPLLSMLAFGFAAILPDVASTPMFGRMPILHIPALVMMATIYGLTLLLLVAPDVLAPEHGCPQREGNGSLNMPEVERIASLVDQHLLTGVYREPTLSLESLAQAIEVSPKRVSTAVNRKFGENFSHLIHQRRLDHFLTRAAAGDLSRHTILELAFDAGFPSKSTFNRVFKDRFGRSPSEYLSQHETFPS